MTKNSADGWPGVLFAALILYLILALHNLLLPGVYYDEVLQVLPAMAAVGFDVGNEFYQMPGSVITVGNVRLPLMIMPYLGPLETFIFTPIFMIFPPTMTTIRITFIVLGSITLILTALAAFKAFGVRVAIITAFLLATDAGYIFYSRADNGPINTMMIIKMAMLLAFALWWNSGKPRWFYVGAFLAGLGIYDKANFLWLLAGGGIVMLILGWRELWERLRNQKQLFLLGALCFLIGVGPFIGYLILSDCGPFRSFVSSFESTTFCTNNLDVIGNLSKRATNFYDLVRGYLSLKEYTTSFTGYETVTERWFSLQPYTLVLAVIAPIFMYLRQHRPLDARLKTVLGLVSLIVIMLFLSIFSPTTLSTHHLLIIYPFPHILIAYAAVVVWDKVGTLNRNHQARSVPDVATRRSSTAQSLVGLLVVCTVVSNLIITMHNHYVLDATGGAGMWSHAIYELSDYLETENQNVACMDWGLCYNLLVLSQGRLKATDQWSQFVYSNANQEHMEALLKAISLFVFHSPRYTGMFTITEEDYPRQMFFKTVEALNLDVELAKTIHQGNGEPLFEIYRVNS